MTPDELPLACPCGFDFVTMTSVLVDQNGRFVEVRRAEVKQGHRPPSGVRGSVVEIRCYCENHHQFTVRFQFHKGRTLVSITDYKPLPRDPSGAVQRPEELWRD